MASLILFIHNINSHLFNYSKEFIPIFFNPLKLFLIYYSFISLIMIFLIYKKYSYSYINSNLILKFNFHLITISIKLVNFLITLFVIKILLLLYLLLVFLIFKMVLIFLYFFSKQYFHFFILCLII